MICSNDEVPNPNFQLSLPHSYAHATPFISFRAFATLDHYWNNGAKFATVMQMRSALREVARSFPTAIISGRRRDKVYEFVQLADVYYAGSHGMDIMAPRQPPKNGDYKQQAKAVDRQMYRLLEERTMHISGVLVEDNKFCLSVHFRQVDQEYWCSLEDEVKTVLEGYPDFCLKWGRKVMEIRPSIKWDKGNALEYLLDTLGFGSSNDVVPLYIGDDLTDEDAFKAVPVRYTRSADKVATPKMFGPGSNFCFLALTCLWFGSLACLHFALIRAGQETDENFAPFCLYRGFLLAAGTLRGDAVPSSTCKMEEKHL
ncbi:hypothetical protein ACLOJK_010183 [Asimina triloba]